MSMIIIAENARAAVAAAESASVSGQFSKLDIFHHCRVMSEQRTIGRTIGRARLLTTAEEKEKIPTSKTDRFSVKFKRSRSGERRWQQ